MSHKCEVLFPELQLPGLNTGRQITGLWLAHELAVSLRAGWEDVMGAMARLPDNAASMLDTPEGLQAIAIAVAMDLGRDTARPFIVQRH